MKGARGWLMTLLGMLLWFFGAAEAARVALVIGNGAYDPQTGWIPLGSPPKDAAAVGRLLRERLHFDSVIERKNLNRIEMLQALDALQQELKAGDTAFVYYSGHGTQSGDDNYLIPVDAGAPTSALMLQGQSLALRHLMGILEQKQTALNVVVLDACRNNPLTVGKSWGGSGLKGLGRDDLGGETLIAFATAPGRTAADGNGGDLSPYTAVLVEQLGQRQHLWKLFGAVGKRVEEASGGQQRPWMNSSLSDEHYLDGGVVPPPPTGNEEEKYWQEVKSCGKPECFRAYLRKYPRGRYMELAQAQVEEPAKPPVETPVARPLERAKPVVESRPSFEPEMVWIKGGTFQMGSSALELGHQNDEHLHDVTVKEFKIGKHEVTVREFRRFVEATNYQTDAEKQSDGKKGCWARDGNDKAMDWDWREWANWRKPNKDQLTQDNHPVACVSWNDAMAYIHWLNNETGKQFRLPTEAEWEYAARGGTKTARFWGEKPGDACSYANVTDRTLVPPTNDSWSHPHECTDGYPFASPVEKFKPNPFGLHDMLGNVWEWVCSEYQENYNGSEIQCVPKNHTKEILSRGGSWYNLPTCVRSAFRFRNTPNARNATIGFRLASSVF